MKCLFSFSLAGLFGLPLVCHANKACNICLDTPAYTTELRTGKGGSANGLPQTRKLDRPLFKGDLFYTLDGAAKLPLPRGKGIFVQINDNKKKHKIRILNAFGKSEGFIAFDCEEYPYGTKIVFEQSGFYSPGWKTYPLPKDEKKCPWHPEH